MSALISENVAFENRLVSPFILSYPSSAFTPRDSAPGVTLYENLERSSLIGCSDAFLPKITITHS